MSHFDLGCLVVVPILTISLQSDGKFGLWLDSTFERGFSTRCPAFDNEVLSGKPERSPSGVEEGKFEVLDVEVWRVGS